MKREYLKLLVAAALAVFVTMPAFAQNVRPVAIGSSGEPTLQSILAGSSGFGTVDAFSGQSSASLWSLDTLPTVSVPSGILPTMQVEWAGNNSINQLGIWSGSNAVTIFDGSATTGSIANVRWDTLTTGEVLSGSGIGIHTGTFSGISASQFGFFLNGADGNIYSADSENGGSALMLAYESPSNPHDWMFGFEDTKFGDKDYQDMVFTVSDLVTAIPEPETYAMLLAGLGLMVFVARRRRQYAAA